MSLKIQGGIVNINEYHDNSTEYNIDARGKDLASVLRAIEAEDVEPIQAEPVQSPSGELFKYIHVAVTSDDERLQIHRMVSNIVHLPKMQQVCDELYKLMKSKKVLCSINPDSMLVELRRMGLPDASQEGFSDKNFSHYYKAPKLD